MFYQYRAYRRDAATIYDIENIRHGVVYARTPLQMNDPFDSMVGFSPEKIYDECIDLALDYGKTVEFIDALNKLKKTFYSRCNRSYFCCKYATVYYEKCRKLYKKSPADVKRYFDKSTFLIFAMLIKDYKNVENRLPLLLATTPGLKLPYFATFATVSGKM